MKNMILILLVGILFFACNSVNQETTEKAEYSIINLSENVTEVAQLPLSDAVQKVDIVPLETTNETLLNSIDKIEVTNEFIFIYIHRNAEILRFTRNGKFLNKIGKQGQGPGEYSYLQGFQIDENKREIYAITTGNGVYVYDFEGVFKGEITDFLSLKSRFSSISNNEFLLFDDCFFYTQTMPFYKPIREDSIWSVTVADKQFQTKNIFYNPAYQGRIESINENLIDANKLTNYWQEYPISMDTYQSELTLKYPDTDTIYVYDQSSQQLKPQYLIYSKEPKGDYGKTHFWFKERSAFDYLSIYSYYPSKDFIYLTGSQGDEIYTFAYNKKDATVKRSTKQGTIIERKIPGFNLGTYRRIERPFILANDICGGDFQIRYRSNGKYWIDIQALNYESYMVDVEKISSSKVKNEQDKQVLLDTFKNLNEDSNPVLLIATLK